MRGLKFLIFSIPGLLIPAIMHLTPSSGMAVTTGLLLGLAPHSLFAQLNVTQKEDVGLTALQLELGASMPTGAGISVTQVEASLSGNYRPNTGAFPSKTFTFPSGGSTGASSHATTVGQFLWGTNSAAPDAGSTASGAIITGYEANDWLNAGFLRSASSSLLPGVETSQVQNHSWVYDSSDLLLEGASLAQTLRRADYAITRDDYVMVSALNNNNAGAVPELMSTAYNGITVGLSNGAHSYGTTDIDGPGRSRPDIVVPVNATSWATATVSGAAAMLLDSAADSGFTNASHHETVKALLLTGATKEESEFTHTWSHTTTTPLDTVYGAGELNVQNSHHILAAGEQNASGDTLLGLNGWDFGTASSSTDQTYFFEIPEGFTATLTATLTWDRIVTANDIQPGSGVSYSFGSVLADMNLHLFSASGFAVDTTLDESLSDIDNLEHLYTQGLGSGTYAIAVSSDSTGTGQNYGLAWTTQLTPVPEPATALLAGLACIPLASLRRRRA